MENKYAGMTVNERLYVRGMMGEFDKAAKERDVESVRRILSNVGLAEESIKPILEQMGL